MWVARDKDGILWLYERRPSKRNIKWDCASYYDPCMRIDDKDERFCHIRWEDDTPTEVELKEVVDNVDSER